MECQATPLKERLERISRMGARQLKETILLVELHAPPGQAHRQSAVLEYGAVECAERVV